MRATGFRPPAPGPLGLGGIMSNALAMFRAAPLALIVVALVSTLPVALLATAGDITYGPAEGSTEQALRALVQLVPVLLLGPISTAATTVLAIDMLHGRPTGASRALEPVGERFWPMAAVVVLATAGFILGLAALVVPGIVVLVLWLFAAQVAVVERRGVRESFARSVALVRGAFWWTFGSFLAVSLTVGLAAALLASVLSVAAVPLSGDAELAGVGLATLIASTVIQPVGNLGLALIFLERRMRREGAWPDPVITAADRA
ncbi:MAG TPA: hypothetical protein VNT51_01805 [Miltoncostaeaceae bacterium]|nr:hypothetical protein [Miltoncostaeaceae bacterium]